jgi:hypothetical protein
MKNLDSKFTSKFWKGLFHEVQTCKQDNIEKSLDVKEKMFHQELIQRGVFVKSVRVKIEKL